jgi:hypothetical protein
VREDGSPIGWIDAAGVQRHRDGGELYACLSAGGSLFRPEATLRSALDAALSSPSGIGIAVDESGAVLGGVEAEEVIDSLEAARRDAEVREAEARAEDEETAEAGESEEAEDTAEVQDSDPPGYVVIYDDDAGDTEVTSYVVDYPDEEPDPDTDPDPDPEPGTV